MRLLLLEGANSIGGTKIYLEEQGVGVLLDFGINYGRWGRYFEEYLKPRSGRGLYDVWTLRLCPKVDGLYRDDLVPGDFSPSYEHTLDVQALFISHAHLDHCGLLGLVRGDIPLYTSAVSAAIMKAMQDSGRLDFHAEMVYQNPRGPMDGEPRGLKAIRGEASRGRHVFSVLGEDLDRLQPFWQMPPNPKALDPKASVKRFQPGRLAPAPASIEGLRFRAYPVDHSIPGAVAFAFESTDGLVVYTGDLRLHGKQGDVTRNFVEAMRRERPYLLIVEGTRLGRKDDGQAENVTEQHVSEQALDIVRRSAGRLVIADFGPRHFERLASFLSIARETGRTLLVFTKDGYLLEALAAADAELNLLDNQVLGFFDELRLAPQAWEGDFRRRHSTRLVSPEKVKEDPGAFVLAFSFWDMNDLLDVHPRDAVYIYSSSEVYGEDQRVDMWRLWNWMQFYGMEVHGFRWHGHDGHDERGSAEFTGQLHASGHISPDDLLWLLKEIRPRYVLPVHTQDRPWFTEQLRGEPMRVALTEDGDWFHPSGA